MVDTYIEQRSGSTQHRRAVRVCVGADHRKGLRKRPNQGVKSINVRNLSAHGLLWNKNEKARRSDGEKRIEGF